MTQKKARAKNDNKSKVVLVFGTFDGLHAGHIHFLRQARKLGDELVVNLPPAQVIKQLKGKSPKFSYQQRAKALRQSGLPCRIVRGDKTLGVFSNVFVEKPDIIALGYDQKKLKEALQKWIKKYQINTQLVELQPYKPEKYKSSLLRKIV